MKILKKYSIWLILVTPAIIYFTLFFLYTVDAPINDDYGAILDFLNQYLSATTIEGKFKHLYSQHNEHRIVYDKVCTLLVYKLFNKVNFNVLALVGNLTLILITIIFYKKFIVLKKSTILFLPFTVLLLNIAFWENTTFAMAALSNFTVLLFILLSLWYLTLPTISYTHVIIALIFFTFALYTQGGGIFLFPVSILILFIRKEYRKLLFYSITGTVLCFSYFYNYISPGHNTPLIDILIDFKVRVLLFTFSFLGGAFNYFTIFTNDMEESNYVSCIIGFLLFLLFLYITMTKYYRKNLFIYSIMVTMIFFAFATAISRSSWGLELATAPRYRTSSALFILSIYYWFLETYSISLKRKLLIVGSTLLYFIFINLNHYEYLSFRERQTLTGILFYNDGNPNFINGDKTAINYYTNILKKSEDLNVYRFPSNKTISYYFPFSKKISNLNSTNTDDHFSAVIDKVEKLSDSYLIDGYGFLNTHSTAEQKIYVGVKNENDSLPIFYTSKQIPRFDLNPAYNKFYLTDGGYIARIKNSEIKKGENTLWLMIKVNNEISISTTDKKIIK